MLAEYMQEERRGSALEWTPNKREQKRPNEQWGLNSIYGQPTSHLLSIPLAALVNCIQDKYNEHQNDEPQRTYAAIATLY